MDKVCVMVIEVSAPQALCNHGKTRHNRCIPSLPQKGLIVVTDASESVPIARAIAAWHFWLNTPYSDMVEEASTGWPSASLPTRRRLAREPYQAKFPNMVGNFGRGRPIQKTTHTFE